MATAIDPHAVIEPISDNEVTFKSRLTWHSQVIKMIEDKTAQRKALECMPVDDLIIKATQNLSTLENDSSLEDCLILELLHWFKYSFFSWVDAPNCDKCDKLTVNRGAVKPTTDEAEWFARTVENYYCSACDVYTRFPRYNNPTILLKTRRGRCGEWAICFALICRASDIDVRLVVDWTDHVWIEMFSPSRQKWIHCDPCENICDQPLLYEVGWKKKLSFVIAFSKDEVQDVTWRYTRQFSEVLKRRLDCQCREQFVLFWIGRHTKKCRSNVTQEKLDFLLKRQALELVELLTPPEMSNESLGGRISGSVSWRLARGEISAENSNNSYVFNLNTREKERKKIHVQYSCAANEYIRVSDGASRTKNWNSCVFESKDIFQKVETDWKVAYLARFEQSSVGQISWKFDFGSSDLIVKKLRLNLFGKTFHQGTVKWFIQPIQSIGSCLKKMIFNEVVQQTFSDNEDFKEATALVITAELSMGDGPQAWQHAQLFRQPLESKEFPFEVEIYFEKINH